MNVEQLEAAIWADPDDWAKYVALARLHARAERRQRALMYLREVGHRVPRGADAHAVIGEVYVGLGEAALAEPHLKLAIAIAPKEATTRLLFARALLARARFGEAEVALRLATKLGATGRDVRRAITAGLDPSEDPGTARARLVSHQGASEEESALVSLLSMLEGDPPATVEAPDFASDLDWLRVSEALELFFARRSTGRLVVVDATRRAEIRLLEGFVVDLRVEGQATLVDHLIAHYGPAESSSSMSVEALQASLLDSGRVVRSDLAEHIEAWCAQHLADLMSWTEGRMTFTPSSPSEATEVVQLDARRLVLAASSLASPSP